jgi:hypothetical protein
MQIRLGFVFSHGGTKDCEGLHRVAGTMEGNWTPHQFFGGMGSCRGLKGPQGTMVLICMERGDHGLPKVSPGPAMPYPSTPCAVGRSTLKRPNSCYRRGPPTGRVACGRLLPHWIPTTYAYAIGAIGNEEAHWIFHAKTLLHFITNWKIA